MFNFKIMVVMCLPILFAPIIFQLIVNWFLLYKHMPEDQIRRIEELTSHLNDPLTSIRSLSKEEIDQYNTDGFLIYRNAIDKNVLEALKIITRHIYENPSGLIQFVNNSAYCGWSFNNVLYFDVYRKVVLKLSILAEIAASLMGTSQVAFAADVMHATTIHCFRENEHIQYQHAHTDHDQAPYSIEKKVNR